MNDDIIARARVTIYLNNDSDYTFLVETAPNELMEGMKLIMSDSGFWSFRDIDGYWHLFNLASIINVDIEPYEVAQQHSGEDHR